jgi:septum formation protein
MSAPADLLGIGPVLLASASPRRAELLRAAGIAFDVRPADVDESLLPGEAPDAYVVRLAKAKAMAVPEPAGQIVVAADTAVVIDSHILGKPTSVDDARTMLMLLSGRTHQVLTAVAVRYRDRLVDARLDTTAVEFAPLTKAEIDWYVASGEPMDKAGAYAVQGLASRFVRRVDGSYSNVVGLPIALVYQMLLAGRLT